MIANVADLLSQARVSRPEGVAVIDAGRDVVLTWAELDDLVGRVAAGLERLGLVSGNRVVIATSNRAEFVATYFAVLRARLVAVPVNPRSTAAEFLRMVGDSGARAVVVDGATVDRAREVLEQLHESPTPASDPADATARATARVQLVALDAEPGVGETSFEDLASAGPEVLPASVDPETLAVLLYTSGASGAPRAAMLTHRALLANIEQVAAIEPAMVREDDVVYAVLPLFHVYGLNAVLGQVVRRTATMVLADAFDPTGSLEQIGRHRVTIVPIAPPVLAHWRQVDGIAEALGSVRMLLSGSAPMPLELVAEFTDRTSIPVHEGYGLTEAAPVVTSTIGSSRVKRGSVGVALPGVRLRIVDETGDPVGLGDDPGEIQISGPNLFDGYWPDAAEAPVDGWFATGDVGYLDEEGDLFLVDRLKELVIVSGFNVYPSEIEDVIAEAEQVREVAVIGEPDPHSGEAVVAYVRPADAGIAQQDLVDAVMAVCEQRLARFKWPSRIEVVADLPRTVTGKIAKGRMRATVRRERFGLIE